MAIMVGAVGIHPLIIVKIWLSKILGGIIQQDWSKIEETIVIDIRTPRVILSALVGMGLASAGVGMQGLFRNPMAEPYVLGMSSGAAVGAALAIVLGIGKILVRKEELTAVMVIHDLNLAARFSDKILMLKEGKFFVEGKPDSVLNEENIFEVYGIKVVVKKEDFIYIIPKYNEYNI